MTVDRPGNLESSVGDLIESAVRKIVTGIVIAGGLIAIGLYSQAGPARYQIIAADGASTGSTRRAGPVIGCQGDRCAIVLRHGQDLEDSIEPPAAPRQVPPPAQSAPAAAPAPALPAPAASAPPATVPAPATR